MSATPSRAGSLDPSTAVVGLISMLVLVLGFTAAANGVDGAYRIHGWLFAIAGAIGVAALLFWNEGAAPAERFDPKFYEEGVIKAGVFATMFWGIAGFLVGLVIALQLTWPNIFYFPDWGFTNFGRLRPLHTSAVIFAFGGNALIATSFYVVQRTCRTRLAGGMWPWFVFWGYQLFIVIAATG